MNSAFFESSKAIANEFLQSIVFIDDKAYVSGEAPNHHEFDALQITQAFARSRKVCAVYKPETEADIDDLAMLAKKADITVIDWQLNVQAEEVSENSEEDAEDDDPRGPHTKRIIREILSDPITGEGSLKLVVIFTGEIDLYDITDQIFIDLTAAGLGGLQQGDCTVFTSNIKILIRAKPSSDVGEGEQKFKHTPELNAKVIAYEALPDFILTEFTMLTSGLLSDFVLQSLSALRNSTFRLIKLYNSELDPSFLAHRLLLPNQEDSKEQLIETLAHSIEALLNYNQTGEAASQNRINDWINAHTFANNVISISGKDLIIDSAFIQSWATNGFVETCKTSWTAAGHGDLTAKQIEKLVSREKNDLHREGSTYLRSQGENEDIDSKFSILTHHKSNLRQPSATPILSLGALIKDQQSETYFLCIQAKCDSKRIDAVRKFLFLRLDVITGNAKFHFVVEDENAFVRLKLVKEAFELRTVKFTPDADHQTVLATENIGQYIFTSIYGETLVWLADLKDAHAQRVANNFAAQLSRVGLDESEWLRRWARTS